MKPHRHSLYRTFANAAAGVVHAFKYERNMKIHTAAALMVFIAAALLQLDIIRWLFLVVAVGLVITAELINTAIEAVVDLVSPEEHPYARIAKDTAAGAVLVAAAAAAIIGIAVFYKPLMHWIKSFW